MSEISIVGIVGSLRVGSVNRAVAQAAVANQPKGFQLELFDVSSVPLYNGDIEEVGLPASVTALNRIVEQANGIVFFSPEYNGSFPAVTKNVVDWLSRPPKSWQATAVTMVSATPGPRAGQGVREHFSAIMAHQPVRLYDTMGIGTYGDKLGPNGALQDVATISELSDFLDRFGVFASEVPDDSEDQA